MQSIGPFAATGNWYKANLHTHTTQSDGLYSPEQAVAWYREHDYDVLAITDHWVFTPGGEWAGGRPFLTLAGCEAHGADYHMLLLGLSALPDQRLADAPERLVGAVHDQGGLAFCAHPYWTGQTSADVARMGPLDGLEVYNSVCEVMDGLGLANVQWDERLAAGQRMLGLAVDDVHWRHGAQGGGWVWIRAAQRSEQAMIEALRAGAFYASSGPAIHDLRLVDLDSGQTGLEVVCDPCQTITFYGKRSSGRRFHAADTPLERAMLPLSAEQGYLRVECCDADGHRAWTNPLYLDDLLA